MKKRFHPQRAAITGTRHQPVESSTCYPHTHHDEDERGEYASVIASPTNGADSAGAQRWRQSSETLSR